MKKVILASGSPRRRELLAKFIKEFDIIVPDIIEDMQEDISIVDNLKKLSTQKAQAVYTAGDNDLVIIGADTIVDINGKILGKPANLKEAFDMLLMLNGKCHMVHTGVTVINCGVVETFVETTKVFFNRNSESLINSYVNTNEPLGKAGAYAIQGVGSVLIEKIEGDYNNVVGLPLSRLVNLLISHNIINI